MEKLLKSVMFIAFLIAMISCRGNGAKGDTPTPKEEKLTLNFNVEGKNGTLKAFVGASEKQTGDKIAKGSTVSFKASPEENYEVDKWTGGVQEDVADRTKASIKADSDVTITVSFRQKQAEPKEVEIVKVVIDNKEWNSSTKEIIMPKDSTSFAKEKVRVWARAKTTTDTIEELEVDTISKEPIVPTEEGTKITITTKANTKFKAGTVDVMVKKLGNKEDVILTRITVKINNEDKNADMISNTITIDTYNANLKITKDDLKVEGKAFGDATSTPLEVESIDPVEVAVSPLGTIFTIKTKETEKYNSTSHNITIVKRASPVNFKCIKLKYAWGQYYESKVEDGISVITVSPSNANKEFTVDDIKVEFGGLDKGMFNVSSITPTKIVPSNEGFGAKCIVRINGTYGSIGIIEIPFYIRHR
ncbi:MAG: InlB B-repeat-containing protein [Treponema sp.]